MKNDVICFCGKLKGTTTLVIPTNKKNPKPILAYEINGQFYTNNRQGLIFCVSCDKAACTSGDWK